MSNCICRSILLLIAVAAILAPARGSAEARRAGIADCAVSGWEAETHVLYGDKQAIARKISAGRFGIGRRVFYLVVDDGSQAKIYEFEHKEDGYHVRATSSADARAFNDEVAAAIVKTRGKCCVGKAVQDADAYKGLKLEDAGKPNGEPPAFLPQYVNGAPGQFLQVTLHVLC